MPSTYTSLHYHLIFSTKFRRPSIDFDRRSRLHAYLGGTVRGLGGVPQAVGGVEDHVHLLVGLKPTHCVSDFLRELKKSSSGWMSTEAGRTDFQWQEGFAAFTISPTECDDVASYIAGQEEHQKRESFRDELIRLLKRAGRIR